MKVIMPRVKREWVDEIIVVDGNSTDGTCEYAEKMGYRLIRQKTKGIVNGYFEALDVAIGDIVITFSPDGNSIPELIPALIDKMKEGYDMVIVSRYREGAKSIDDDPVTAFGNWLFTTLINFLFGGHYTDSLVMFRAWRKEIVQAFDRHSAVAGIEPQTSIECAKAKLRVTEIPGDEPRRIGGMRKLIPWYHGFEILKLIVKELFTPPLSIDRVRNTVVKTANAYPRHSESRPSGAGRRISVRMNRDPSSPSPSPCSGSESSG